MTAGVRAVIDLLDARYEAHKEYLVTEESPIIRGMAQEVKYLRKKLTE